MSRPQIIPGVCLVVILSCSLFTANPQPISPEWFKPYWKYVAKRHNWSAQQREEAFLYQERPVPRVMIANFNWLESNLLELSTQLQKYIDQLAKEDGEKRSIRDDRAWILELLENTEEGLEALLDNKLERLKELADGAKGKVDRSEPGTNYHAMWNCQYLYLEAARRAVTPSK